MRRGGLSYNKMGRRSSVSQKNWQMFLNVVNNMLLLPTVGRIFFLPHAQQFFGVQW